MSLRPQIRVVGYEICGRRFLDGIFLSDETPSEFASIFGRFHLKRGTRRPRFDRNPPPTRERSCACQITEHLNEFSLPPGAHFP